MRIALLGLGKMGAPVACLLQKNGHQLTVWNRTAAAAQPFAEAGAHVARTASEAVMGMPIVFTMLSDDGKWKDTNTTYNRFGNRSPRKRHPTLCHPEPVTLLNAVERVRCMGPGAEGYGLRMLRKNSPA